MSGLEGLSDAELIQKYQQSVGPSSPLRITVRPPGVDPASMSDEQLQAAYQAAQPNYGRDIAKSVGSGLVEGVAGLAGLPQAVGEIGSRGLNWIGSKVGMEPRPDLYETGFRLPSTEDATKFIENNITGPLPKSETLPGQYARTAASFIPGALLAPGGMASNALRFGVVPGLASEAAGQATQGTSYEPVARVAGALGAGGAIAALARPGSAAGAIRAQMPEGITPQIVDQAHTLMNDAHGMGVNLSWPEALSQAAQRPVLSDMARHLEASGPTTGRMADFYAQRPQQVEQAGRQALDTIAPPNANPSMIGPQAGAAADEVLNRVRQAINTATRPSYDAARQSLVPQSVHAAMRNDPLFEQALNAVRDDPALNSNIRGLSDRSTIVYDAVKQYLATRGENLASPTSGLARNMTASAANTGLSGDVRQIAVQADRNAMGLQQGQGIGNLEQALANQARLRQQYLEPLQRGPLGKIAGADTTTQKAMNALFPANPLPNSADEIRTTVQALANRNPNVAGDLVRAHAESTFNEATQALQSGANQMGGAKFRAVLVGNPQQRANFEAAVESLPYGQQRLDGFNRFLDVMEAIGTRQNIGSKTAYNAEFLKGASASGIAGEIVKGAANPISRLSKGLIDKYERWSLGRNLNELADILTNPAAVGQLRAIAHMPVNSPQAATIALRLANLSRSASDAQVQQSRQ